MKKKYCLIHANCQGEPLCDLLALAKNFSKYWDVTYRVNYTKEPVTEKDLESCDFFIYQYLDERWGDLASARLLAKLSPGAETFCLPNMFFKGYWPFYTSVSPIDFGDILLNKLIDAGAQKPEILRLYVYGDIRKFVDLESTFAETLACEKNKEDKTSIAYTPVIEEFYQSELLFYTVNHPAKRLLLHTAQAVMPAMGVSVAPSALAAYQPEYSDFELPIHPQVAQHLGLDFCPADTMFPIFGRKLTFIQYISRYIDCRLNNMDEMFHAYLQKV